MIQMGREEEGCADIHFLSLFSECPIGSDPR